jgi:hypothetical protein
MELNQLQTVSNHDEGAECNILSPIDGLPTDVFIKIKGADSKAWRAVKKSQMSKIIAARSEDKMDKLDYEQMDIEALAEVTISWRGIAKDGKPYDFSKENALNLYKESPAVTSQLIAFIEQRANFIKG